MNLLSSSSSIRAGVLGLSMLAASAAWAETLTISGPGGSIEDRLREFVFPGFEKKYGATVRYEASQASEIIAKLQAQKSNQPYDLVILNDGVMFEADDRGFCASLVADPIYSDLTPGSQPTPNSVGISAVGTVIAIRTDIFAEKNLPEPSSWLDLGNDAYEGELALLSIASSTTGIHGLVMVARANGGGESNIDPGMTYFAERIRPNLVTMVQSSSKLQEMLQTGEVAIGVTAASRASALEADGLPIKTILPKEGVPLSVTAMCAVEGGAMGDLAQKFMQYSSSLEGQKGFEPGETSVNKNVEHAASGDAAANEDFINLEWSVINEHKDEWIDRWNREVEY